jgi:hypothetical protein
MLERLLQLQSQQRHGEAAAMLRKTLGQPRLAAAHWQQHVARFGGTLRGRSSRIHVSPNT